MRESRAEKQDIRPLRIAILNLMPLKIATKPSWRGCSAQPRCRSI